MKAKHRTLLFASRPTVIAIALSTSFLNGGTIWDGGGGASTNIDEALNWGGTLNALNGTTAATFATGGSSASINVPARFTTLTFNRDDAAGFTIGGASTLSVNISASSSVQNLLVSGTASNGITTINAPLQVYTTGTTGTRLLNIPNSEADTATPSLVITGGIAASTTANTFNLRFGGSGSTKVSGAITGISGIQQHFNQTFAGKAIIAGNQALGNVAVLIGGTGSGSVSSSARIEMGESTADVQSWSNSTVNQNATLAIKSTATLTSTTSGIDIATATSAGSSGATVEVAGVLSAATLKIGSTAYTGVLKVSGTASFSGALTTGATAGSKIVGNAPTPGTLKLSSGSNLNGTTATVIGGTGDENNLHLVKQGVGILSISGTNTYTGTTTVETGTLDLLGSVVSATTVQSGGLLKISGTSAGAVSVNAGGSVGGEGSLNNTLTFGTGSSSIAFDPATQTGALTANSVDTSAATIIVVTPTGAVTNGTPYVVLKRATGTFSGADLGKFALGTRGGALSLTGGDTEITLTPAASVAASLAWKGNVSGSWDVATTQNWTNGGSPDRFYTGDNVSFDDTASSFTVALAGAVTPGSITFNNTSPNDYTVSGGSIAGGGSLTKGGTGLATVSSTLSHTGGLVVNSGILSLGTTNNNTFTGGIDLNGGELQFGGGSILGSLNTQSVSLDGGAITFKGPATIVNDAQTFAVTTNGSSINVGTPNNITWRIGGVISGSGNWTKSGTGVLALGKNGTTGPTGSTTSSPTTGSTFDGTVTVTAGNLDVRNPDSLGTTVGGTSVANAVLEIFPYGQNQGITISGESLSLSGTSYFRSKNEDPDTDIINEWTGNVTVADNAVVGLGSPKFNAGFVSKFIISGGVSTGVGSVMNLGYYSATVPSAIQEIDVTGAISGPGSVTAQGAAGSLYALSLPGYSGNTTVNSATLSLAADNPNNNTSTVSIAATGATLDLNFAGTDTVDKLYIGGVQQPAGVYEAVGNAGSGTEIAQITGSGTLTVTSNPSGYSSWQSANGAGTQTVDQDHDHDGVDNGVEYFLGGNTNTTGFTSLPVPVGGAVTWVKAATYTGLFGTDFKVQSSTDLTSWTDVSSSGTPGIPGTVHLSGANVTYTLPTAPAKSFVRLLVNPN